jgi:putative tricarboxylic transport membrane protein
MKLRELIPSLFLILTGIIFSFSSVQIGMGKVNTPGPGFVPFLAGSLLILLSLATIVESYYEKNKEIGSTRFLGKHWLKVALILSALLIYALLIDVFGFFPTTFLLLLLVFKVPEKQSWVVAVGASVVTMIFTYLLFVYFIQVSFPTGILGF